MDLLLPSNGSKVFILNHTALGNGVNHAIAVWGSPPRNRHPGTLLGAQMMEQERENIRRTLLLRIQLRWSRKNTGPGDGR